jgi:hypothetical protein
LKAEELIYSIVGPLVSNRCYPVFIPQEITQRPAASFQISRDDSEFICLGHPREMVTATIIFLGKDHDDLRTLKEQAFAAFQADASFISRANDEADYSIETKEWVWELSLELNTDRA